MCILQNQCNLRLLKYKESSMNTKFDYWKCNKMYEKAQLRSDFRKKYLLGWGSNPQKWLLWNRVKSRMEAWYIFRTYFSRDSKCSNYYLGLVRQVWTWSPKPHNILGLQISSAVCRYWRDQRTLGKFLQV